MRTKRRVLYITHSHVSAAAGGVEVYSLELYHAIRAAGEFEPLLLARTGAPHESAAPIHHGAMTSLVGDDPHQYLFFTDLHDYDALMLTNGRKHLCTRFFRDFLRTYKPDLIHFHHTLFLGLEFIVEARHTLPSTPIVYTLHEYVPICHNHGQMVRTGTDEPCLEPSPQRCHGCFPDITSQRFFLRSRFVASHFALVDQFVAPSRFLMERFVDWGISRDKILYEEYGRTLPVEHAAPAGDRPRNRFGFFGRLSHFKGITVLLEAVRLLMAQRAETANAHRDAAQDSLDFHVYLHGAGLDLASAEFQARVRQLLADTSTAVTFIGPYTTSQLSRLMDNVDWVVVPSIWWENSPLVIQEAFAHGRPVICSDMGGMAEKVQDGVSGLHFRANDPQSLADVMNRAMQSTALWNRLHGGIPRVYDMPSHVQSLAGMYRRLMQPVVPA